MANDYRYPSDYKFGTLTTAAAIADTSLVSAEFAGLLGGVYSSTIYLPVVLHDPAVPAFEIVWVTAHTAASTTVTVLRGKESSSARAWPSGTQWLVAPTVRDALLAVTSSTIPSDLSVGTRFVETDTGLVKAKSSTASHVADIGVALPSQVGPARAGGFPPAGATIMIRTGHAVVTTNASGDGTVTFREAFPLGCLAVTANSGDAVTFMGFVGITSESATGFTFRALGTGAAPFVGPLRLVFTATGW